MACRVPGVYSSVTRGMGVTMLRSAAPCIFLLHRDEKYETIWHAKNWGRLGRELDEACENFRSTADGVQWLWFANRSPGSIK